jgi:hypothetical protein
MLSTLDSTVFVSTIACRKCGVIGLPVIATGVGPHKFKGSRGSCGKFAIWISDRSPQEKAARSEASRTAAMASKPPSRPQLDYLRALGDEQTPPATMLEAAERISALVAGKAVNQ